MTIHSVKESKGISTETLNLVLAICAILISSASFYATYLQANSAEKQVKAMTLPLIQFSHGNFDDEKNLKSINFDLKNAGVGPAIIKNVTFKYKDNEYDSIGKFFKACCETELETFQSKQRNKSASESSVDFGGWVSQQLTNVIIPGQSNYSFQKVNYGSFTQDFWGKLNKERWLLKLNVCYCSLLDECFITEQSGVVDQIDSCPTKNY